MEPLKNDECAVLMSGMYYIVWMNPEKLEPPNMRTVIVTICPKSKENLTSEDFEIDYGFYNKISNLWHLAENDSESFNVVAWTCFPRPYNPKELLSDRILKDFQNSQSDGIRLQLEELRKQFI